MTGVNETRFLIQHESYESECRLNESICNSKQEWNHDECRCEFKGLDDWDSCVTSLIRHVKLTNI